MPTKTENDARAVHIRQSSRVVRRAFSMSATDAKLIESLRFRYAKLGILMNQSEVVRAGLHALSAMTDAELGKSASTVERLNAPYGTKTGQL